MAVKKRVRAAPKPDKKKIVASYNKLTKQERETLRRVYKLLRSLYLGPQGVFEQLPLNGLLLQIEAYLERQNNGRMTLELLKTDQRQLGLEVDRLRKQRDELARKITRVNAILLTNESA